jgi:hypothetical protein
MNSKLLNGIFGSVAIAMWLAVFLPGLTINSKPYRDAIMDGSLAFADTSMAFLTYTITNVALLCCFAGIIGSCTKRLLRPEEEEEPGYGGEPVNQDMNPIFSGVLRGFLIYLLFLAGVYAATPDPFAAPTPEQYVRMAGTISGLSFVINYDPALFESVIAAAGPKRGKKQTTS